MLNLCEHTNIDGPLMSHIDYSPPNWVKSGAASSTSQTKTSGEEDTQWRLDEVKGGVIVFQHSLCDVPVTLFGRVRPETLPKECQFIITAHESCSRIHARIAFDKSGCPWLRDLGSNNGTSVNNKKLPIRSVGRSENGSGEGSRGVRIYPGDMIQFGASTRCYIIEGPKIYERSNHSAKVSDNKYSSNSFVQKEKSKEKIEEINPVTIQADHGVSWGIDFGATLDDEDREEQIQKCEIDFSLLDSSTIPDKHRKLHDKILAKKYTLTNIREEIRRIQKKEMFSVLSDGQSAQIIRNRNKEQELLQEIQDLETDLMYKLKESNNHELRKDPSLNRKRPRQRDIEDDDDCAFYDRTSVQLTKPTNTTNYHEPTVVETEQSLKEKWNKLFALYDKRKRDTERLKEIVNDVEMEIQQKSNSKAFEDDLFFLKNDLTVARDRWNAALESEQSIEKDLSSIETLLRVVNKEYICDKTTGFVGIKKDSPAMVKHEKPIVEINEPKPDRPATSHAKTGVVPFSNQGTASFIAAAISKSNTNAPSKTEPLQGYNIKYDTTTDRNPAARLHDEWVAPVDQDGTGFTRLNMKFSGRY